MMRGKVREIRNINRENEHFHFFVKFKSIQFNVQVVDSKQKEVALYSMCN